MGGTGGIETRPFTADRDMMPDPAFYADCLVGAYEDLAKATS